MHTRSLADSITFLRANTRAVAVPGLPISLWTADELTPIWQAREADLKRANIEPPFWAFPWAGGQALSRYVLDHAGNVSGMRVLDLACGSGLVAIAAAMAGGIVSANDIDPMCEAALGANAELNGVSVGWIAGDLLDATPAFDVVLAGDVFYEQTMAKRFLAFLQRMHAGGARVFVGDPGRSYFPRDAFIQCAEYEVATSLEIENNPIKSARVWRL